MSTAFSMTQSKEGCSCGSFSSTLRFFMAPRIDCKTRGRLFRISAADEVNVCLPQNTKWKRKIRSPGVWTVSTGWFLHLAAAPKRTHISTKRLVLRGSGPGVCKNDTHQNGVAHVLSDQFHLFPAFTASAQAELVCELRLDFLCHRARARARARVHACVCVCVCVCV